jgi:hypothetical protein
LAKTPRQFLAFFLKQHVSSLCDNFFLTQRGIIYFWRHTLYNYPPSPLLEQGFDTLLLDNFL